MSHSNSFILERGKMCLRRVRTAATGCKEEYFLEWVYVSNQKCRFRVKKCFCPLLHLWLTLSKQLLKTHLQLFPSSWLLKYHILNCFWECCLNFAILTNSNKKFYKNQEMNSILTSTQIKTISNRSTSLALWSVLMTTALPHLMAAFFHGRASVSDNWR